MTEYIPTTGTVRHNYASVYSFGSPEYLKRLAEFDRWLESLQTNTQNVSVRADEEHPKLEGMFLVNNAFHDAYHKCWDAVRVVADAESETDGDTDTYGKLRFVLTMFSMLADFYEDKYFEKLGEVKREVEDV
jgi:hypothetical protein